MAVLRNLAVALLLACLIGSMQAPASAASKSKVSWRFVSAVDAGERPVFRYKAHGVASSDKIRLQRKVGTRWKSVRGLKRTSKTVQTSTLAVPMGEYQYRLVVLTRKNKVRKAVKRRLLSFGDVSMRSLLRPADRDNGGKVTIDGTPFNYVSLVRDTDDDGYSQARSTCRSAMVRVGVPPTPPPGAGEAATPGALHWQIQPTSGSKQTTSSVTLSAGTIAHATWRIPIGAEWAFGTGGDEWDKYLNGTFNCYKRTLLE